MLVEEIGDPLQSDGCFPAACRSLNDQYPVAVIPDDLILLFLYRGHNGFHMVIGTLPENVLKHFVADGYSCIEHRFDFAAANHELAF